MQPFIFTVTAAGLNALVNAQAGQTEAIRIAEAGLSDQAFDAAPTLTALPGEFKRIGSVSGQSAAPTIIHMTAQDASADGYELFGLGLFLADGTLFASYSQATPILRKVSISTALLALDLAFDQAVDAAITFGDANFLYPPATETTKGVARIATSALAEAAESDDTMVTPLKLGQRLDPILDAIAAEASTRATADDDESDARAAADGALGEAIDAEADARTAADAALGDALATEATARGDADNALDAALAREADDREAADTAEATARGNADATLQALVEALQGRSISGTGLATGTGTLGAGNIAIAVLAASAAQVQQGTSDTAAITPKSLGPIVKLFAQSGYVSVPGGDPTATLLLQWGRFTANANSSPFITFPMAFSSAAFAVVVDGTSDTNVNAQDNFPTVRVPSISATGFTCFNANDSADQCCFFAIGQVNLA